jgi:hypothetical protein
VTSCVSGITGTCYHAWLIDWAQISLTYFLPRLASNHDPPDLYLLSSWDYRCEPKFFGSVIIFSSSISGWLLLEFLSLFDEAWLSWFSVIPISGYSQG